jgi:hypothetical protein
MNFTSCCRGNGKPKPAARHQFGVVITTDLARPRLDQHDADPKPFQWAKSANDMLAAIERFCTYNTSAT